MKKTNDALQKDLKTMEEMVASLQLRLVESEQKYQEHIKSKDGIISALHHQLFILKNVKFGRKSEKLEEDKQLDLHFDEAELLSAEVVEPEEIVETRTVTIKKKKPGRKPLPSNLPYIEHVHDINDADKQYACGCALTLIGNETTEQLDVLPQVTYRVVNIRKKYACKACEETIVTAKQPRQPFPKSLATAGLVAGVIDAKFNRHLPLYRQEDIFKSMGADASSILFSLVQTCKEHDVDVFAYFKYALESVINCTHEQDIQSLLPYNVNPELLKAQRAMPVLLHACK